MISTNEYERIRKECLSMLDSKPYKLTNEQIAKEAYVSLSWLNRFKKGDFKEPGYNKMAMVHKVLRKHM